MNTGKFALSLACISATLLIANCGGGGGSNTPPPRVEDPDARFEADIALNSFYKGNTHTHTENSFDTDASRNAQATNVLRWYIDNGYDFVVITDHDVEFQPALYPNEASQIVIIPGEEVSPKWIDRNTPDSETLSGFNERPVHAVSICTQETPIGRSGTVYFENDTRETVLDDNIVKINGDLPMPGIPIVAHPYLAKALTVDDVRNVSGYQLLEIANQDDKTLEFNDGYTENGKTQPPIEDLWDLVLTNDGDGRPMYGIAADDAHDYRDPATIVPGVDEPLGAEPGTGWVQVAAASLDKDTMCASIENGNFYSSTGVELVKIETNDRVMSIEIDAANAAGYETRFIGKNGRVFKTASATLKPSYTMLGDEQYIRAVVTGPNGKQAWVQPVFITSP
jgi:hypothetical protein